LELLIEIERVFDFFNDRFCAGELKKPLILLSTSYGIPTYGWFGVSDWKQKNDELLYEINICAEHLDREPYFIIETLIHEMAHLKNHQQGIIDIDPVSQFHFETYKTAAESLGLVVRKHKAKGWAYTKLGDESLKAIQDCNLKIKAFDICLK
jgi:hypothetical protein